MYTFRFNLPRSKEQHITMTKQIFCPARIKNST